MIQIAPSFLSHGFLHSADYNTAAGFAKGEKGERPRDVGREAGTQAKALGPAALRDAGAVSMTTQGGPLPQAQDRKKRGCQGSEPTWWGHCAP